MRKFHHSKEWLSQVEVHLLAAQYRLRFCIIRGRAAQAGEGFASILQTYGKGGVEIRLDISRIEVSESTWWGFIRFRGDLGVYRYSDPGELPQLLHVGYLPGHSPKGALSFARRMRRRRQRVNKRRTYRGYRQKIPGIARL